MKDRLIIAIKAWLWLVAFLLYLLVVASFAGMVAVSKFLFSGKGRPLIS